MIEELKRLMEKVEDNKKNKKGPCSGCPVVDSKYLGPLFIETNSNNKPEIAIVSESPAIPEDLKSSTGRKIEEIKEVWGKSILNEPKEGKKNWPTKLIPFLTKLTDGKIWAVDEKDYRLKTISDIYWTHTVKCFIQVGDETIRIAKNNLKNNGFNKVVKCCSEYLREELDILKNLNLKLYIFIGKTAAGKVAKKYFKDVEDGEKIILYHPSYLGRNEKKDGEIKKDYEDIREKIKEILK